MIKKEVANILKPYNEDIKRHMSALSEDFQSKVKVVAELALDVKKTVDSHTKILESHTEMVGNIMMDVETLKQDVGTLKQDVGTLKQDMTVVKSDIQIIKTDNKQKISYPDFTQLQSRVGLLESRAGRR